MLLPEIGTKKQIITGHRKEMFPEVKTQKWKSKCLQSKTGLDTLISRRNSHFQQFKSRNEGMQD